LENNNIDISNLVVDNFEISLDLRVPDKLHREFIGINFWNQIFNYAINKANGTCQGCGYRPNDLNSLELHVLEGDLKNIESYKFALLCKSCHTLQHVDVASEQEWIKLCNSIYSQEKLIHICRSGNNILLSKIQTKEIILLNLDPKKYSEDIKEDVFNKRKTIKAIFGSKFPENRLK
jgi:hypothetical protein